MIHSCDECSDYKGCEDCCWCDENGECVLEKGDNEDD